MCTGAEALAAASLAVTAAGTYASYDAAQRAPKPQVVNQDPLADENAAKTQAAQESEMLKLEARRKARANSLLSQAGGAGDQGMPELGKPVAVGKTTFGE